MLASRFAPTRRAIRHRQLPVAADVLGFCSDAQRFISLPIERFAPNFQLVAERFVTPLQSIKQNAVPRCSYRKEAWTRDGDIEPKCPELFVD